MSKNTIVESGINPHLWETVVRPAVLKRDNFQCQKCGKKEKLDVHHKVPDLQVFNNLITLCRTCHKEEHANNENTK